MSDLLDIKAPEIKINIDGKECNLEYGNRELYELCKLFNVSKIELKDLVFDDKLTVEQEIQLIHAGLTKHNPDIKIDKVWECHIPSISVEVFEAFLYPYVNPKIYEKVKIEIKKQEPEKNLEGDAGKKLESPPDVSGQKNTQ